MTGELISTAQAAELLGVRPATVYSYVARGILEREVGTSRHEGSLFRRTEVIALRNTRLRKRSGIFELGIETGITRIDPEGRLFYRGHDATDLACSVSYERVAELLWQTGELDWSPTAASRQAAAVALNAARQAGPAARARLAVAVLAAHRSSLVDETVEAGVAAVNAAVGALHPSLGSLKDPLVRRMTIALSGRDDEHVGAVINAAMVLLADHELATSAVAARVAASTGAKTLDVLTAGLSAMPGPRHAQVSIAAAELLRRARADGVRTAVEDWTGRLPGFGHMVYAAPDPRYTCLLDVLATVSEEVATRTEDLALEVLRRTGRHPNVDLALAALEIGIPLSKGSGETIFTVARIAGLVAHYLEEQGQPLRFRPRADYTGPG